MRRRRQKLEVSTFPFLAVLLCTMGSLILVLLVIDRKGKAGARAKAMQAAILRAREDESVLAARQAEWERRREALRSALEDEVDKVRDEASGIQQKAGDVQLSMQTTELHLHELTQRVVNERAALTVAEKDLLARRSELAANDQQSEATKAQLRKMSADLDALERTVHDLKTARRRQQDTYSLIPYRGKHGDNRKPVYVECSRRGLVFFPDQQTLEGDDLAPMDIRQLVQRRLAQKRAAASKDDAPYLLMLLRPSGIANYYRTIGALVGLNIDFGYELVDEDWVLDFPEDDNEARPQPWMRPKIPVVTSTPGNGRGGIAGGVGLGSPTAPGGSGNSRGGRPEGSGEGSLVGTPAGSPGLGMLGYGEGAERGGAGRGYPGSLGNGIGPRGTGGTGTGPGGLGVPATNGNGNGSGTGAPGAGNGFGNAGGTGAPGTEPGGSGRGSGDGTGTVGNGGGAGEPGAANGFGNGGGAGSPGATGSEPGGIRGGTNGPSGVGLGGTGNGTDGSSKGNPSSHQDINNRARDGAVAGRDGFTGKGPLPTDVAARPGVGSGTNATGTGGAAANGSGTASAGPGTCGSGTSAGSTGGAGGTTGAGSGGNGEGTGGGKPALAASATGGTGEGTPSAGVARYTPPSSSAGGAGGSSAGGSCPAGGCPPEKPRETKSPPPSGAAPPPEFSPDNSRGSGSAADDPGDGTIDPVGRLRPPGSEGRPDRTPSPPKRPARVNGGREWVIPIECTSEGVVVPAGGSQKISVATLQRSEGAAALRQAVKTMIDRRQATVRPGEIPYQPQIRLLVRPEGLRAYYFAFPALETLQVPMTRTNVSYDSDKP